MRYRIPRIQRSDPGTFEEYIKEKEVFGKLVASLDETSVPITIRLDAAEVAILDHLVERWKENRSRVACELLEIMIWRSFNELYKDVDEKKRDEMAGYLISEFDKKRKTKKKKK